MSEDKSLVGQFDKRVTSMWVIILLGFTKAAEETVKLTSDFVTVTVAGIDVTMLALYLTLGTAGTTALIARRTMK